MNYQPILFALGIAFAILLAGTPAGAADIPDLSQESMRRAAEEFYSIGLDPAHVYPIAQARLQRDRLAIELEGGTLVLAKPILGRVTGACYTGRARLSLDPPTASERASLKARTDSEQFRAETEALYLRFNDTTVADLTFALSPAANSTAFDRCAKIFSNRNDVVRRYENNTTGFPFSLEVDLLESLLSPMLARDFFLLEAEVENRGWVTYFHLPAIGREVALLRLKPVGSMFDPEAWAWYPLDLDPARAAARQRASDIEHNQMEIVIPNIDTFTIDALLTWKGVVDLGSARFVLLNSFWGSTWDDPAAKPVTVEAVQAEDGTSLPFVHRRHELLVKLPSSLPAGRSSRLRIKAAEKTIRQITPESFSLLNTHPWFPHEREYLGGTHTFDWIVKVRRPFTAAGTGTLVRAWEDKATKLNCEQWKSDTPVAMPSLLFGQFKETKGEYKRKADGRPVGIRLHWMPAITVSDLSAGENSYVESAGPSTARYTVPLSKPPQMVKEVGIILDYYEQVLGPYPNDEIDVAQMGPGMWFGQAPPGLVQITSEYFLSQALISSLSDRPETMEFLRTVLPHEIAHHYWGDVVRWASPEDEWLSESLAEYSSGLYLEASEGDKAFRQKRDSWRKMAERWEGKLPILHANRASGENGGDIRAALLYNKGPLIVHMLRSQVGIENFAKILKKVLVDHAGRAIDTADFQAAAEAVTGYKLDWFFDQWVRGTGIPELRFSYTVTPQAGKYLLNARLTQEDKAKPKALFVPLEFDFGGDRRGKKEWRVKGADERLQVMLPEKPVKVRIDAAGDLLAKIVYDGG